MKRQHLLWITSLCLATLCLALGLWLAGQWLLALASLIPAILMILGYRFPHHWLDSLSLITFVILAAVGVLLGAPASLILIGLTCALASWDLLRLDFLLATSLPGASDKLEKEHLKALLFAIVPGLVLGLLGLLIHFAIPFWVMVLGVMVMFYALDRAFQVLGGQGW